MGRDIDIKISGDLRRAPAQVRRELANQVAGALQAVPPEGTMLTVICDSAGGRLFLTYPGDDIPASSPPESDITGSAGSSCTPVGSASHSLVHLTTDVDDGRVYLEMHWDDTHQPAECADPAPA